MHSFSHSINVSHQSCSNCQIWEKYLNVFKNLARHCKNKLWVGVIVQWIMIKISLICVDRSNKYVQYLDILPTIWILSRFSHLGEHSSFFTAAEPASLRNHQRYQCKASWNKVSLKYLTENYLQQPATLKSIVMIVTSSAHECNNKTVIAHIWLLFYTRNMNMTKTVLPHSLTPDSCFLLSDSRQARECNWIRMRYQICLYSYVE